MNSAVKLNSPDALDRHAYLRLGRQIDIETGVARGRSLVEYFTVAPEITSPP